MPENRKYRITEMLYRLPMKRHHQAIKILPEELSVSVATFNNWRSIEADDKKDIPYTAVVKMEQFFGLQAGELINIEISVRPLEKRPEPSGDIANEFSLSK